MSSAATIPAATEPLPSLLYVNNSIAYVTDAIYLYSSQTGAVPVAGPLGLGEVLLGSPLGPVKLCGPTDSFAWVSIVSNSSDWKFCAFSSFCHRPSDPQHC
jgi:hypothetical protein